LLNIGGHVIGSLVGGPIGGQLAGRGINWLENRYNDNHRTYDGSFFNGGQGGSLGFGSGWGNTGYGGSAMGGYGGQYGGNMPGLGTTGYGTGNSVAPNPYNVDPITGLPIDPSSIGPYGQGGGGGAGNGANVGNGMTGINSGGNRFTGALAGWGAGNGPNYS
jgi:hypothetical protein